MLFDKLTDFKSIKDMEIETGIDYNGIIKLLKYQNYISLYNRRFLFVSRNKFGNNNSFLLFNKSFKNITIYEKMYICYYIFCFDLEKCFYDFQYESNYNIFRKMTKEQYNLFENKMLKIHYQKIYIYEKFFKKNKR